MKLQVLKGFVTLTLMTLCGFGIGVGALYGWQYLNRPAAITEIETAAHFATTDKMLIVYSASWCEYCQKVKNYLDQHNIAYENRDIESTDTAILQLFQTLGATGIPQILIGNKVIRGADLEA